MPPAIIIFVGFVAKAQDTVSIASNGRAYPEIFDSLSTGLIEERIPYGVLYDRVFPWSNLTEWSDGDTISSMRARQAWWDLENSHVGTFSETYPAMRDSMYNNALRNRILIPMVRYNFATIDTNALNDGRLSLVNGILTDNNLTQHPYDSHQVTFAALPVDSIFEDTEYKLVFDEAWILNNTTDEFAEVKVTDLTDENQPTYSLGLNDMVPITLNDTGWHLLKIEAKLSGGQTFTSYQQMHVMMKRTIDDCSNPAGHLVESDIPFQGYNETVATTSIGNYAIYYRYKAGSTEECEDKLEKPIIILDGIDFLDIRSIEKLYKNELQYTDNGSTVYLGETLRSLGYDVIILNFPVIGSAETEHKTEVKSYTGSTYNGYVSRLGRDGGSDYIERNAFLLVKLIQQINDSLTTNGSTEELVVVGPSMGGQVSRYALAYMEQEFAATTNPDFDHNTRLWVSFDSPHLGANIPIGSQQTLEFFGYTGGKQEAAKALETKILSPAARQMLIEQLDGLNNQSAFRQSYISNLTSNGLSGSNGFPVNLRKVALANGSGTGTNTSFAGAEYLSMEGRKTFANIKVVELHTNYLNNYGALQRTMKARITIPHFLGFTMITEEISLTNSNPRGIMDIVPGGTYNSQEDLKVQFSEFMDEEGVDYTWDTYRKNHTFIPSVSSLAFINPNFNWSTRIDDRNLVCNSEIPFDNYFFAATNLNEAHVFLTKANADWLEQEITKGLPGCDNICTHLLTGGSQWVCSGSNYTFSLDVAVPSAVTVQWSLSSGLSLVSSNSSSVTITSNGYNPSAVITATLVNPCGANTVITRIVGSGQPNATFNFVQVGSTCWFEAVASPVNSNYVYSWSENGTNYTNGNHTYGEFIPMTGSNVPVWLKITNACGVSTYQKNFTVQTAPSGCMWKKDWNTSINTTENKEMPLLIYPNPTSENWNLSLEEDGVKGMDLLDGLGRVIINSVSYNVNNSVVIHGSHLTTGIYYLRIHWAGSIKVIKLIKN
ncbi:MAG: T9SS type A sorting domain-containing protein [Bacteroidia bacterium]